jgi:hypothetical protein
MRQPNCKGRSSVRSMGLSGRLKMSVHVELYLTKAIVFIAVTAQRKSEPWLERNMSTPSGGLVLREFPRGRKVIAAAFMRVFESVWLVSKICTLLRTRKKGMENSYG